MRLQKLNSANEFLLLCEGVLLKNETQNNLILGLADRLVSQPQIGDAKLFYAIFDDSDSVVGGALRTNKDKPISLSQLNNKEINLLVQELKNINPPLEGVVAESNTAEYFSNEFSRVANLTTELLMHQGVYECHALKIPPNNNLVLHRALIQDVETVAGLIMGFIKDALPKEPVSTVRARILAQAHIENGNLFLLKNDKDEFVSMACNNRETKNSGCVSFVYTPKEYRGHGYGSLVTALVSNEVLKKGKRFCNLFTDLSNPTSNKIYNNIGYKKIGESKHFSFL